MSELPIYPRVTGPEANHCFWGYCGSRTNRTFGWYGTNQYGAFVRICNTAPKIRFPHTGNEEVLQDGYRLVLLPKLAFYAMWDGHGESFAVPRATRNSAEVALPIGSYTSAPDVGTDTPGGTPCSCELSDWCCASWSKSSAAPQTPPRQQWVGFSVLPVPGKALRDL